MLIGSTRGAGKLRARTGAVVRDCPAGLATRGCGGLWQHANARHVRLSIAVGDLRLPSCVPPWMYIHGTPGGAGHTGCARKGAPPCMVLPLRSCNHMWPPHAPASAPLHARGVPPPLTAHLMQAVAARECCAPPCGHASHTSSVHGQADQVCPPGCQSAPHGAHTACAQRPPLPESPIWNAAQHTGAAAAAGHA